MDDCPVCMGKGRLLVGMTYPPGKTIAVKFEYDPCPNCTQGPHSFHAKQTADHIRNIRKEATP